MELKRKFTEEEIDKVIQCNIKTTEMNEKLYKLVTVYEEKVFKMAKQKDYFIFFLIMTNIFLSSIVAKYIF